MQNVLGQSDAVMLLEKALRTGRMHHAWIFSGPFGVGKRTTAVAVGRILLDRDAKPDDAGVPRADPASRATRLVDAGSHPDLHLINKELALYSDSRSLRERKLINIPLDLLRERMLGGRTSDDKYHEPPAYRTAVEGHRKVFIIDEAELIDRTAQNALLKTLEEPPPETFIFLITNRPERLLPTIRSRAQHVRFGPLDASALAQWFEGAGLELAPDERAWIEWYCQGSPGAALLATQYGLYQWQKTLEPMLEELVGGRAPASLGLTLSGFVEGFAEDWVKKHTGASKDAANKAGTRHLLNLLAAHARRELDRVCREQGDPQPWLEMIDLLPEAERQIDSNVNLKHVFENLAAQWACAAV